MKHRKKTILGIVFGLAALAGSTAFYQSALVQKHGAAEGIDQLAHYMWGYTKTASALPRAAQACDAHSSTMDFAVRREFTQKSAEKQKSGLWCKSGCRRDLRYWNKGSLDALGTFAATKSCPQDYKKNLPAQSRSL
jgi:hypothetical protein